MIDGHFENIPRIGTVDPDRTGDRVDLLKVEYRHISHPRIHRQLAT